MPGQLPLAVQSFERIGTLTEGNGKKYTRDIGCSGLFNGIPIFLFGDTFTFNNNGQMINLKTSTAARGDPQNPTRSTYWETDREGKPAQFVPFTGGEWEFNKAKQGGGKERYYVWTFSKIAEVSPGKGWMFFPKGRTQSQNMGDNLHFGVQLASVETGPNGLPVVKRIMGDPLWPTGEVSWGSFDTIVVNDWVYLYGGKDGHTYICRFPRNADPREKGKYQFWVKPGKWSSQPGDYAQMFWKLQSGTVFWSEFYNCFILVGCTGWADNRIIMRSAPRPEGPWTGDSVLHQLEKPKSGFNYCMNAHPWGFPESHGGQLLVSWTDQHTGVVEMGKVTWKGYQE
ncbi:uncharacterized protein V1518DRAFT_412940 [Limtongia smithiae]|uniref:uncharacterized protein n=1 Tax=Limtongia smithiae TaxID=1125753 RepID=UPI0034CD0D4B